MNRAGFSLVEVLLAVLLVVILSVQGLHHYSLAAEGTRVDTACATLRSIWVAERLYRMEHASYDADIVDLAARGLIEKHVAEQAEPFSYAIESADASEFVARAVRHGGGAWQGSITIDATGAWSGWVENSEGVRVSPPIQ